MKIKQASQGDSDYNNIQWMLSWYKEGCKELEKSQIWQWKDHRINKVQIIWVIAYLSEMEMKEKIEYHIDMKK